MFGCEEHGELQGHWGWEFSLTGKGLAWSAGVREGTRRGLSACGSGLSLGKVPRGMKSSERWTDSLSGK